MIRKRLLLSVLIFLLMAFGCHKAETAKKEEKQELKKYKVHSVEVRSYIEATGTVQPDLEGTSKILSYFSGVVNSISVKVGDIVRKGQPLVAIKSPELTDVYSNYLSTLTQIRQAERIYNLNKELFQIGAVTKNDMLASEANYNQLKAVAEGLKSKLAMYGSPTDEASMAQRQFSDTLLISAPSAGVVADIQTHVGDKVDPSTPLMTLADPKKVVIVANIFDTDIPKIKKGSNVVFATDAFPNMRFDGVISYVSDVSDTDSKTVKTFIKILGKKELFKQNMFLKLKIEGGDKLYPLVPQTAMVYKEGKFYVYQMTNKQTCELKEIKPVSEVSGKWVAVQGLNDGEEIVLTAIDMERP
jgi:membrane fusion protein, heavy metal efflux system